MPQIQVCLYSRDKAWPVSRPSRQYWASPFVPPGTWGFIQLALRPPRQPIHSLQRPTGPYFPPMFQCKLSSCPSLWQVRDLGVNCLLGSQGIPRLGGPVPGSQGLRCGEVRQWVPEIQKCSICKHSGGSWNFLIYNSQMPAFWTHSLSNFSDALCQQQLQPQASC